MRNILSVLFCFLAVQPCFAQTVPVLAVPSAETPLQLTIPLPKDVRLDVAGHWQLEEKDFPENKITVQIIPAMKEDGTAGESAVSVMANVPPRKNSPAMRQFLLKPAAQKADGKPAFGFQEVDDKSLKILDGQTPVYVYNHGEITDDKVPAKDTRRTRACYVHPVWGLQGEALTDDFPKDHYHHHGVFWAWPHVGIGDKQYDLWKYTDIKQEFVRWICRQTGPAGAVLAVENGWFADGKKVMIERCWIRTFSADQQSRSIDFQFVFMPVDNPITLRGAEGKSYGGLNMRFAVKDEKKSVVTVPGGPAKEDLPETPLPWADMTYPFTSPSTPSGAALFVPTDHPNYPPTWLTRHYGILSIGWPGVKDKTFPAGQPIRLSYRIWIHKSAASLADLEKAYAAYALNNKAEWKVVVEEKPLAKTEKAFWDAVKERENSVRSFEWRWDERTEETVPQTASKVTYNRQWQIVVDGKKVYVKETGDPSPHNEIPEKDYSSTTVYNGNSTRRYSPGSGQVYPHGYVFRGITSTVLDSVSTRGVVLCYRSQDMLAYYSAKTYGPFESTAKRNGPLDFSKEILDGKEYFVVSFRLGADANLLVKTWFDPARKFIPVREQMIKRTWFDPERGFINVPDRQDAKIIQQNEPIGQFDIDYTVDDKHGFVPTSWKYSNGSNSQEQSFSRRIKVTGWSINPTVSAETFDFEFPTGTYVNDQTDNTEYIVRSDGSKRLVTRQEWERGATYESLLNSDPDKK